MSLTNCLVMRKQYFHSLENEGYFLDVLEEQPETFGGSLVFRDFRSFLIYLSTVWFKEVVYNDSITVKDYANPAVNEFTTYEGLLSTTVINSSYSFVFKPITFNTKNPLTFYDEMLLGEKNTYKPFNSQNKPVNTMLTRNLVDIKSFSDDTYKFSRFRGIVAFARVSNHKKGYTIYLADKDLYLTVVSSNYSIAKGYTAYIAVVYNKGT